MKKRASRTLKVLTGALAAALSGACTSDAPTEARPSVRDSAGIRIIENVGHESVASAWSIPDEPIFRVGWGEDDPQFQVLWSGYVGDDRIWVADRGSNLIYSFSPSGELLATLGGEGEGPGEFRMVGALLGLGGDSLVAFDFRNPRLTYFAGDAYSHDVRYENRHADGLYTPLGRSEDGVYVLAPGSIALRMDEPGGFRHFPVFRTSDLATEDTIGVFPLMMRFHPPGDMNPIYHYASAAFTGDRVAHAVSERPQITWYSLDGELVQIARWDAALVSATEEHWAEYERRTRERMGDNPDPAALERLAQREADFGGPLPLFSQAHGDREGNVWLGPYELGASLHSEYDVVSAEGEWLGPVAFPADIRILDITHSTVLGIERNDFDVEAVVLYAIEKPGR